jgi:hypothetical protein
MPTILRVIREHPCLLVYDNSDLHHRFRNSRKDSIYREIAHPVAGVGLPNGHHRMHEDYVEPR